MAYNYFKAEYAIQIHDKIIKISGGREGIKDYGNIESPLAHIQNDDYYPGLKEKITHLIFSFNKFHAFNDGNKRTSIAMGAFFLEINGLENLIDKFIIEMENISVGVADNIIDKELLGEIITSLLNDNDYSEPLKLSIVIALQQVSTQNYELKFGATFYKDLY